MLFSLGSISCQKRSSFNYIRRENTEFIELLVKVYLFDKMLFTFNRNGTIMKEK